MPTFRYKAVTASGETVERELDGTDRATVIQQLRDRGLLPIKVQPATSRLAASSSLAQLPFRRRLSHAELARFVHELGTLLHAGVPLDRALQLLVDVADRAALRNLAQDLLGRVRGGSTLADALAAQGPLVPREHVGMVRAGEAGATLEQVLLRMGELMERAAALRGRVVSSLIYPAILIAMAVVSVVVLFAYVLPSFAPIFADLGAELPLPTRLVMALGELVNRYGAAALLVLLLLMMSARLWTRSQHGRLAWHRLLLRLPIVGPLAVRIETARFSRTLGTLLRNGVTLVTGLELTRDVAGNAALARALSRAREQVKSGRGLAEQLQRTGLFPGMAVRLIQVGEESGQLEEMLFKLADIYDAETERAIQRLLTLLVPVLTLALGALVAFIIASILLALLSMNDLAM